MPAVPKLRYRGRLVGRIKVLGKHEAEHQSKPDRHVRIRAEVEVNLKSIGNCPEPCIQESDRSRIEGGIRHLPRWICQKNLFSQSQSDEGRPTREFFKA